MSTITLQDKLALLRRRVARRRRLDAGVAVLAVVGLSLVAWAPLWVAAASFASLLPR